MEPGQRWAEAGEEEEDELIIDVRTGLGERRPRKGRSYKDVVEGQKAGKSEGKGGVSVGGQS